MSITPGILCKECWNSLAAQPFTSNRPTKPYQRAKSSFAGWFQKQCCFLHKMCTAATCFHFIQTNAPPPLCRKTQSHTVSKIISFPRGPCLSLSQCEVVMSVIALYSQKWLQFYKNIPCSSPLMKRKSQAWYSYTNNFTLPQWNAKAVWHFYLIIQHLMGWKVKVHHWKQPSDPLNRSGPTFHNTGPPQASYFFFWKAQLTLWNLCKLIC